MAIYLIDKIKPKNSGSFALMEAADVEMPDGSRLSELTVCYPVQGAQTELQPEHYYVFGEVDSLSVTLAEADDGKVHEYCFEFVPTENFTGLTVTPEPKWVHAPQYPAGHTCQVSVLRGIGVMICA